MINLNNINNFTFDEIEESAKDIIQTLAELELPRALAVMALCRAIVLVGGPEELDKACWYIDEFADLPPYGIEIALEDDDDPR